MIAFENEAKESKVRSTLKWWINSISMAIARTASRNVAFKVAMMRDFIMEGQHEFIMRRTESNGLESEVEDKKALEDVTYNAELFIANQEEVNTLDSDANTNADLFYIFRSSLSFSLDLTKRTLQHEVIWHLCSVKTSFS